MDIEECIARCEIQHLLAVWSIGCDDGEFPEWVWADDAVVHAPGGIRLTGSANILGRFRGGSYSYTTRDSDTPVVTEQPPVPFISPIGPDQPTFRRHNLTSSLITFEGPREARALTYAVIVSEHGLGGSVRYDDRFRKFDTGWRFTERRTRFEFIHPDPRWDPIREIARKDRIAETGR